MSGFGHLKSKRVSSGGRLTGWASDNTIWYHGFESRWLFSASASFKEIGATQRQEDGVNLSFLSTAKGSSLQECSSEVSKITTKVILLYNYVKQYLMPQMYRAGLGNRKSSGREHLLLQRRVRIRAQADPIHRIKKRINWNSGFSSSQSRCWCPGSAFVAWSIAQCNTKRL